MSKEIARLKHALNAESVQQQFKNALQENAGSFVASIMDLYSSDTYLQQCKPDAVVMECLKAATLKLPINKQLGFAYVVPYKGVPQFQLGYKGYIQLAMRTGQYRYLNAGAVHEGVRINRNMLTGEIAFEGDPTGTKAQGYFAYMELLNGFSKTLYMTYDDVMKHAQRYSRSFSSSGSAWKSNFDEMAMKTVTRLLLSKYGIMSTDMVSALTAEPDSIEDNVAAEIANEANGDIIDAEFEPVEDSEPEQKQSDRQKSRPQQQQLKMQGPGF